MRLNVLKVDLRLKKFGLFQFVFRVILTLLLKIQIAGTFFPRNKAKPNPFLAKNIRRYEMEALTRYE